MGLMITRRRFVGAGVSAAALALGGCQTTGTSGLNARRGIGTFNAERIYGARPDERFPLPAVTLSRLPEKFRCQRVAYATDERPGSIIVDTANYHLYFVEKGGLAIRYGVGLGRQGFEWAGRARVAWKRVWPKWTPPAEMIEREPYLEKYSARHGGMPPGLKNPLGARALYIFQGKVDTLYRVHGTYQTRTIGRAVSSGCVRMINQDVIDLYGRVRDGAPIVVT